MIAMSISEPGWLRATAVVAALAATAPLLAQHEATHERHGRRHGNPADLETYIERLQDPARDAWQRPEDVIAALGLERGQTACDIGAGPGYFSLRLARAVGDTGHVYAVDVEPVILDALREALEGAGVRHVTPVLALPEHALLPRGACDLVLIVNTYHHFPDGPAYLRQLARALRPGGRVVNLDYRVDAAIGPRHRIPRDDFVSQAMDAGYELAREESFLPHQYFVVLQPTSTN